MKKEKSRVLGTKKWFYWVSIGIVLIVIYKLLDNFTGIATWLQNLLAILTPFVGGILIAYILYTPCSKLERGLLKSKNKFINSHARVISITIVFAVVLALIVWLMAFIVPTLISSISDLIKNVQNYYNSVVSENSNLTIAPFIQDNILKPVVDWIQKMDYESLFTIDRIKEYLSSAVGVIKWIVNMFIALICSVYILTQRSRIVRFLDRFVRATLASRGYARYKKYFTSGNEIFFRYLSSQMLDGLVVAIITSIAMSIIGVKYSLLLGTLIGLSNLIPYFGAIFGVGIAIIITLLTGGWEQAIVMAVVIIILQQIDANLINPRITSSSLKVSPLLVMFAVTLGGAYFGILGMFISVPVIVLVKAIIEDFISERVDDKEQIEE